MKTQYSILAYSNASTEDLIARAAALGVKESDRQGKSEARRRSFFAGRAALAAAFEKMGIEATVTPHPFFGYLQAKSQTGTFYANISHTQEIAVAVVGISPVGIDIESVDRDPSRVLKRVSEPSEILFALDHSLKTSQGDVPFGISLWSAKEAFSKAIGLGIKFGMQHLHVDLSGENPFAARTVLKGPLKVKNPAVRLERYENFVVALCSEKETLSDLGRFVC